MRVARWVTDREIHAEDVKAFVDDLTKIGDRYQNVSAAIGLRGYLRTTRDSAWRRRIIRPFSVHSPMPELVAELNRYRPGVLVGYVSMITLLAAEQEAGRLHIHPMLVQPAGETFAEGDRARVAKAFDSKIRTIYGATECTYLSYGCEQGWHHVNTDCAVLEPVDADYRPPLPAVQVRGRAGDVLTFPTERGEQVSLAPLTFGTLLDRTPGVDLFQIVQTQPDTLRVRLRLAGGADPDRVWNAAHRELTTLLADNKLDNVTVERAGEPVPDNRRTSTPATRIAQPSLCQFDRVRRLTSR